ncbi:MAG TPA: ABC transporter ATP-binding protein [Methanomassiliicoccales archaeon]|jgi:oligopeptide/dipeptide ABC transporter ATP-binding protein
MPNDEMLLQIEDLRVHFHTRSGVVQALDGITFGIKKGETFGLVGETGCGKSVTANTVLRLIPSPPGKIESGKIFFLRPSATPERKEAMEQEVKDYVSGHPGLPEDDPHLARLKQDIIETERRIELNSKIRGLRESGKTDSDPELGVLVKELQELDSRYDILQRSIGFMQKIRGKNISMIFQEPMSALNPVFTAGEQIYEIILQHEKISLNEIAIEKLNEEIAHIKSFKRAKKVRTEKGEYECSNCRAIVTDESVRCPQCDSSFVSRPFRHLTRMKMGFQVKTFKRYIKDPNDLSVRIISRTPILRRIQKPIKAEAVDRAERMLRLVRIPDPDHVINSFPFELSGGMQQRVMIAMALACKPQLLIADEPTTALDVTIQAQILRLMKELQEETGTSILLITHNLGVVSETCDRVGVMYAGTMAEIAGKMDLFKEPLHPYTQGLLNSIPKVNADIKRLETIEGSVPNLITPPAGCRFNPRCPYAMEKCRSVKPYLQEVRAGHFVACHLYGGGD